MYVIQASFDTELTSKEVLGKTSKTFEHYSQHNYNTNLSHQVTLLFIEPYINLLMSHPADLSVLMMSRKVSFS